MNNATNNTAKKNGAAERAMRQWSNDWGGLKGVPAPSVNQIVRAVTLRSHNLILGPSGAFGYYGANAFRVMARGYRDSLRPAKCKVWVDNETGMVSGMSAIPEAGRETVPGIEKAERLWARYARMAHYMRETRHDWQLIGDVYYADNSVEREFRSQLTGEVRRKMVTAPSGDACF